MQSGAGAAGGGAKRRGWQTALTSQTWPPMSTVLAACSTNVAARSRPSAVANSSEIRAQSVTFETSMPYLVASLNQIRIACG
eukprot:scaffold22549_cov52-Phaeocystis_antarctica.AAC.2